MDTNQQQVGTSKIKGALVALFNDAGWSGQDIAQLQAEITTTTTGIPQRADLTPDQIASELAHFDADDAGNADAVQFLCGDEFLYCDAYGVMRYTGRCHSSSGAEAALDMAIVATLRARRKAAVDNDREAVIKAAKPDTKNVRNCKAQLLSRWSVEASEFDNNPDVLNSGSGVIDLRTGQLTPHHHSQRFTYCLHTNYNPQADTSLVDKFLLSVVKGGREVVDYMQIMHGYFGTGRTSLERLLYNHGPTRAGKGTWSEWNLDVLGPLARTVDFASLVARRDPDSNNFDLAPLKHCRMIIADESRRYQALDAEKIKKLTGGNEITCSFKHKNQFTYRPQFKILMISNWELNADPDDDAMWHRVNVIEFPNSHAGCEDFGLKERTKSKPYREALLAWIVAGAQKFYSAGAGGVPVPEVVKIATQKQRDALDSVQQWIEEKCLVGEGNYCQNDVVYQSYEAWCKANGVTPKQQRGLSSTLSKKGFGIGVQKKVDGKNYKGVTGLIVQ